jgi:hypothetical protein
MSLLGWIEAAGLSRRARQTADPVQRAELLVRAAAGHGTAARHLEAAVALAQAGRTAESAESWRKSIARDPLLIPDRTQLDALRSVVPTVAPEIVKALIHDRGARAKWRLQRRGCFDGEERWRLEQAGQDTLDALLPTLRYLALLIAQISAAPGRLRLECDWQNDDDEAYLPITQLGEVLFAWDESRQPGEPRPVA